MVKTQKLWVETKLDTKMFIFYNSIYRKSKNRPNILSLWEQISGHQVWGDMIEKDYEGTFAGPFFLYLHYCITYVDVYNCQ